MSLTGDGFTAEHWRTANAPLWLAGGPTACDFYAEADNDLRVSADGRLTGTFVVPSFGNCRQSSIDGLRMPAGRYRLVFQCTACTIGEFDVTADGSAAVPVRHRRLCPNSDNLASDIMAFGLSCSEAEALVRKVGGPLGLINGAPRTEADGFTCVPTSQEDRGLPSAIYECIRAAQRITYVHT